jgi:hypothetical protein
MDSYNTFGTFKLYWPKKEKRTNNNDILSNTQNTKEYIKKTRTTSKCAVNSGTSEWKTVPAPFVTPIV